MTLFKTIITSSVIVVITALHPSLNKGDTPITSLQHYIYGNSLRVSTNDSIDKNLIQITWVCQNPNDTAKKLLIFKDGKQLHKIPSKKGTQKLVIYYQGNIIGEVTQYKNEKNQAHQYHINLLAKNNSVFFKGSITGPSSFQSASATRVKL
jgi:hypothetical protein